MVRRWHGTLKGIFTAFHGHLIKALAHCSCAMVISGHCHSGRVAAMMAGKAKVASHRRRLERLIARQSPTAEQLMNTLAASILSGWQGRPIILILDETSRSLRPRQGIDPPQGNSLCCMKVSVGYRKRALPLAFECYRTREHHRSGENESLPDKVGALLENLATIIPEGSSVTLLADRGLCWPVLIDFCRQHHWHYVFRLQGQTALRYTDASEQLHSTYVNQLLKHPGEQWFGQDVEVFKTAGWKKANVIAVWENRCKEPWLLVSDQPAIYARCRGYAKRVWCEQMHRDEKSAGFNWRKSHVDDPVHASRLLVLMALAMLLAISTGSYVIKAGLRHCLEARKNRQLSIFQIGLRYLRNCLQNPDNTSDCRIHLYPP